MYEICGEKKGSKMTPSHRLRQLEGWWHHSCRGTGMMRIMRSVWSILNLMCVWISQWAAEHRMRGHCQRTDALELWCWRRLLRVPWTARIQPVHPKGNQLWTFIGRTDAEAEAPTYWPSDAKSRLTGKDPGAWKDWGQKGMTEDEMMDGITNSMDMRWWKTGKLACCSPWGCKELDTTVQLNNNTSYHSDGCCCC